MFTLRMLDLVAVALLCARRRVPRFTKALVVGGSAFLLWYQNPVACTCIRIPLVRCERTLPWRAMLRSDLGNLASQQEIHRMDHGVYSDDPVALAFWPSDGVTVRIEAGPRAWSATATHHLLEEESCRMSVKNDDRGEGEAADREVVCGR